MLDVSWLEEGRPCGCSRWVDGRVSSSCPEDWEGGEGSEGFKDWSIVSSLKNPARSGGAEMMVRIVGDGRGDLLYALVKARRGGSPDWEWLARGLRSSVLRNIFFLPFCILLWHAAVAWLYTIALHCWLQDISLLFRMSPNRALSTCNVLAQTTLDSYLQCVSRQVTQDYRYLLARTSLSTVRGNKTEMASQSTSPPSSGNW